MTLGEFRQEYPEFDVVRSAAVQSALDTAKSIAGRAGNLAWGLCAAHLLSISSNEKGVVVEEWVGSRRAKYITQGKSRFNGDFFATSSYGKEYLSVLKSSPVPFPRAWV